MLNHILYNEDSIIKANNFSKTLAAVVYYITFYLIGYV